MFDLILENKSGDKLEFGMNSPFTITDFQGLNPPKATINTSQSALLDGAKFNSSKVQTRHINVAFAIEYEAEKNRLAVYKVLKSKQWVKLTYISQYRNVWIEGYVDSIDISYWKKKNIVTCGILCPAPYFKAAQEMVNDLMIIIKQFSFPFHSTDANQIVMGYIDNTAGVNVENDGDVECGMVIELYARGSIENPKIFDYVTQEYIGLNVSMQAGDLITIDTIEGQKSVTLLRSAVKTNIFNTIMAGSTWLQLPANGSTYVYEVGSGIAANLAVTFKHFSLFEGV